MAINSFTHYFNNYEAIDVTKEIEKRIYTNEEEQCDSPLLSTLPAEIRAIIYSKLDTKSQFNYQISSKRLFNENECEPIAIDITAFHYSFLKWEEAINTQLDSFMPFLLKDEKPPSSDSEKFIQVLNNVQKLTASFKCYCIFLLAYMPKAYLLKHLYETAIQRQTAMIQDKIALLVAIDSKCKELLDRQN